MYYTNYTIQETTRLIIYFTRRGRRKEMLKALRVMKIREPMLYKSVINCLYNWGFYFPELKNYV